LKKAKRRSAKNPRFGLPEDVARAFNRLANAQRNAPEDAMTNIQKLHAGVLAFVVEHTGDLTHRMSEQYATDSNTMGYSYVKDKVEKVLHTLNHPYGFEKEHKENIVVSARYHHVDLAEYNKTLDKLLEDYALAHKKLVVYNETQDFAKRAAVYLGEQKWSRAVVVLEILQNLLKDKDAYLQKASDFTLKNGLLQKFKTSIGKNPMAKTKELSGCLLSKQEQVVKAIHPTVNKFFSTKMPLARFKKSFRFESGHVSLLPPSILRGLKGYSVGAYHHSASNSGNDPKYIESKLQAAVDKVLMSKFGQTAEEIGLRIKIENWSGHVSLVFSFRKLYANWVAPVSKSNPLHDEDLAACYYGLLRLRSNPDASEDIDEEILDALESEGLWNIDSGVTKEGTDWLESVSSDSHDD